MLATATIWEATIRGDQGAVMPFWNIPRTVRKHSLSLSVITYIAQLF